MRTRRGAACLVMLLLCLGGALANASHQLAVPHRVCQVHGRIEHGLAEAPAAAGPGREAGPLVERKATPHEECGFAPFTRPEPALAPVAQSGFVVLLEPRAANPPQPDLPARSELYLWAPSRSPPA